MEQAKLELVGYDCVLGRYPSPARPIVKNPNYNKKDSQDCKYRYIAVSLDDRSQVNSEPIHNDFSFIKLSAARKRKLELENFNCRQHRLFAISENKLRFYPPSKKVLFFNQLLDDKTFAQEDPFLRISLAKKINDIDRLIQELDAAERYLELHEPDLLMFVEHERSQLAEASTKKIKVSSEQSDLRQDSIISSNRDLFSDSDLNSEPTKNNAKHLNRLKFRILTHKFTGLIYKADPQPV